MSFEFSFVKPQIPIHTPEYHEARSQEVNISNKVRFAVRTCKSNLRINTTDLSKLHNDEKESIVNCLKKNYLDQDPNFFGQRDLIFLDLH